MFLESPRFPDDIALESSGGPRFSTSLIVTGSGTEYANRNWLEPLRSWNIGSSIKEEQDIYLIYDFFMAVGGPANTWRFKDWTDYRSGPPTEKVAITALDQAIGTGTGSLTTFQLKKTYTKGALSTVRTIAKPVTGTVLVAVNSVPQSSGWSVNTTTGIVTFTTPPANGLAVTAGFEFDIPCRFEDDFMEQALRAVTANEIPRIMIHEVRL